MRPFLYALYFAPIVFGAVMLIRSVYIGAEASEHALPETFECSTATKQLESELWILYDSSMRSLDAESGRTEPMPGRWRNWEATRAQAEANCPALKVKMEALLQVRRAFENNLYLLSHEAGAALAEIHKL